MFVFNFDSQVVYLLLSPLHLYLSADFFSDCLSLDSFLFRLKYAEYF